LYPEIRTWKYPKSPVRTNSVVSVHIYDCGLPAKTIKRQDIGNQNIGFLPFQAIPWNHKNPEYL